ncbi:glycosyl hydrolase family 61-domain-containing protein, partial [Cytidiella melzeri]
VSAHGYVNQIGIDGQWYAGNKPGEDLQEFSPIRAVSDGGPLQLEGAAATDFVCGKNASKAQLSAPARAGSLIAFNWVGMDGTSAWIHRVGPLVTYMTPCGAASCEEYEPTVDTKWFKVAELGQLPNDTTRWYQGEISSTATYNLRLPEDLAQGGYLIRHELISLQNAISPNGIEFYPMCAQLLVNSKGTGEANATVTFPAAYNASIGDLIFDAYTPPVPSYFFPGGPLSNIITSGQVMGPAAPPPPAFSSSSQNSSSTSSSSSSIAPPGQNHLPQASGYSSGDATTTQRPLCMIKSDSAYELRVRHLAMRSTLCKLR